MGTYNKGANARAARKWYDLGVTQLDNIERYLVNLAVFLCAVSSCAWLVLIWSVLT